jgi:hypothetical protein
MVAEVVKQSIWLRIVIIEASLRATKYKSKKLSACTFRPEVGGSMFLRNVAIYLQVHTALQHRQQTSASANDVHSTLVN